MKRILSLDIKYSAIQFIFFGSVCAVMGYASVYLLDQGVSNSLIGTILAAISVIVVFTQPAIAAYADKNKHIELRKIISAVMVLAVILSVATFFVKDVVVLLLCVYVGISTCIQTVMPLMNSLAFVFEKQGIEINYGIARGIGSAAYALVSFALGYLVEDFGTSVIPLVYIFFNVLLVLAVNSFVLPKSERKDVAEVEEEKATEEKQLSFIDFFKKYKKFMIFVLGVVVVYFTHTIINNFFIQILTPIGGTESDMGTAVFLAAIVELPAMGLFNSIRKKVKVSTLLKFSAIMFAVKHALTFLATDMTLIYVAQFCQIAAYAILIPASVYYVNSIVAKQDQIKGQSMVTMAMTASGIVANLAGGFLLDGIGVHNVLLMGTVISVIGAVIVMLSVERVD
ncbi:MAG: MFS transporter [Bacilli bacterium]|nr:MFS transporter [Bacilli bacterium]